MLGRWWVLLAAAFAGAGVFAAAGESNDANADTIKLGTLAPSDSPWAQVFKVWGKAVDQKTGGGTTLDWQWNGTAGDENQMVSSMKSGQLHGAAITAVGLGQIYPTVLVFQLPGAFASWQKLDAARNAMRSTLDAKFEAQSFKVLGWGDVGKGHIMSVGFEVKTPADLSKGPTFYISGDPIGPAFFQAVGGNIQYKQMSIPEVYPNLGSNIQIINAPALGAEQLQWASKITNVNSMVTGYGIGALIFWKPTFDGLGDDVKKVLADTGAVAASNLTSRIRNLDDQAWARMKSTKTVYEVSDADKAEWEAKFATTRSSVRNRPFEAAIQDKALQLGH